MCFYLDKEREEDDSDNSRYQNNTSKTKKHCLNSKEKLVDKGNTVRFKIIDKCCIKEKTWAQRVLRFNQESWWFNQERALKDSDFKAKNV